MRSGLFFMFVMTAEGSPSALVVRNTFRFRCPGVLGGQCQDDQGDQVGHHVVDGTRDLKGCQEGESAVYVGQRAEETEQEGCSRDVQGLPLTEDHNGQGQEAEACDAGLKLPLGDACGDVDDSAQTAEKTGDQDAGPAHHFDVDTDGVGCRGVLAACHKTKAEAGLIEDEVGDEKEDQGCQHEPVELEPADIDDQGLLRLHVLNRGGDVVRVLRDVDGLDDNGCERCCQHVHSCADQCLVRAEVNACDAKESRVDHSQKHGGKDNQQNNDKS